MNREQRRQGAKNMGLEPGEHVELKAITILLTNGKSMIMDLNQVMLVDRATGKPVFDVVIEGEAAE